MQGQSSPERLSSGRITFARSILLNRIWVLSEWANIENKPEPQLSHPRELRKQNPEIHVQISRWEHRRVAEFMTRLRNIWPHLAAVVPLRVRAHKAGGVHFVHGAANRPYQLISRLISDLCNHQTCNNNVINNQFSSLLSRSSALCMLDCWCAAPAQYQFDTREWALKETQVSVMTARQLAVSQENF